MKPEQGVTAEAGVYAPHCQGWRLSHRDDGQAGTVTRADGAGIAQADPRRKRECSWKLALMSWSERPQA